MVPFASLLLASPLLAAGPGCPAAQPAPTFEARFEYVRACARGAYVGDTPILDSVSLVDLKRLPDSEAAGTTAPGRRRDLVVELIEGIEAVERLQTKPGRPQAEPVERFRLMRLAKERLGLDEPGNARVAARYRPNVFRRANDALTRAQGEAASLPTGTDPGDLPGGSGARPELARRDAPAAGPGPRTVRTVAPPAPLADVRREIEARSRLENARIASAFEGAYDDSSLPFKNASEFWRREQEDEAIRPGETAAGYVARRSAAALAGPPMDWLSVAEKQAQALAYRLSDPRHSRRAGETSLKPDGYGITVYLAGESRRHPFRDPKEGERFLAAQKDGAVQRVIFYGHGAPGMQTVGDDFVLNADGVAQLAKGKVRRGGRVELIGCNTAAIGSDAFKGPDVVGASLYGVATLARRLTYYSMARAGGIDRKTAEAAWNEDLARDVSLRLPGVEVRGMRTFAIPLDRLFPGADSPTPSEYVIGRQARYLDGREI